MLDLRQNPGRSAEWFPGSYLRRLSRVLGLPAFFVSANWTGAEWSFFVGLDGYFLASSGADALSVHSWVQMFCPLGNVCLVPSFPSLLRSCSVSTAGTEQLSKVGRPWPWGGAGHHPLHEPCHRPPPRVGGGDTLPGAFCSGGCMCPLPSP